ncbi:MAG: hypothetical protein LAT84_09330 [Balneolia bacterium]|nr:hypothetical protein [Balneolia bacterium]
MSIRARLLIILAGLILIPLWYIPFWSISMTAPQYPEGIGMYISINDIQGHNRHDLQSINTLNHYIGMKEIHKEEIPELRIIPWIVKAMIAFALIVGLTGNQKLLISWVVLFIVLSLAGIADYWWWGYDYGHNLDPRAPIKVPGMSYQPPLIGTKQLLNIRASSFPYWGSAFLALSFGFATASAWLNKSAARPQN